METQSDALIAERHTTHGDFHDNAEFSQHMKRVARALMAGSSWNDEMREAVDMICLKISRVVTGQALELDHWRDVAGYAALALKSIRKPGSSTALPNLAKKLELRLKGPDYAIRTRHLPGKCLIALDAIFTALSLLLDGGPQYEDHWGWIVDAANEVADNYWGESNSA